MVANIIELLIKGNAKSATSSLKKAKNETRATRIEISLMIDNLAQLAKTLEKITDYSDDYTASMRLLSTTFGKTTKQAVAFRNSLAEVSGLDEALLNRQLAKFDALGKSLNLTNEYADKFSKNLTTLSTKLAMLYNIDASVMAQSVQNAIQGTQTTLRSMTGIEATELAEQAILLDNGINRTVNSLNDAEEAILRYSAILSRVTSDTRIYESAVNSLGWQKQVFTSQIKRLANAIGQLLTPAFNNLLIIVNAVLMVLTELVKIIGSLFNINIDLDASTEDIAEGYENLGNSIAGASASAKKSLRSFDKLNNITTPSSGGGGAGKNLGIDKSILKLLDGVDNTFDKIRNKATEIRDQIMAWLGFTKDVNGEWKWSADTLLKNIWNWWKNLNVLGKIFVGLGIAVVLGKIFTILKNIVSTVILKGFKTLNTSLGKFSGILGGLALSVGGISMIVSGVQKLKEEGANFNNILEIVLGTIGLIGGALVIVGGIMGGLSTTAALATGGISLLIGGIVALIAWFSDQDDQVEHSKSVLSEYKDKILEVKEAQEEGINKIESKVGRIQTLEEELLNLVDANGNVVGSEEEVATKLSALNELMGTEYKLTDGQITLNGKKIKTYDALKTSIDKYCASLRTESYLEVKREEYNTRIEEQLKLEDDLNKKIDNLISTTKDYDLTNHKGVLKWLDDNQNKIDDLGLTMSAYETNQKYLEAYEKAAYLASIGRYDESQKLLTETFARVGTSTEDVIRKIMDKSKEIPSTLSTMVSQIESLKPKVTVTVNADTSNFKRQINSLSSLTSGTSVKIYTSPTSAYAEGGFPSEGEVFISREAGPELVGTINGHTAVANNDQIVKGIQSGVFNGMMSALSNANFSNNVTIEANGDTQGLLDFISFRQKQTERQFN